MTIRSTGARLCAFLVACAAILYVSTALANQPDPNFKPDNSRGVDSGLDYTALSKFGPWDDRNYQLRSEDIAILPSNDRFLPGVPAFFKVLKRKEMAQQGFPLVEDLYPRETDKEFQLRFGGLIQNGVQFFTERGKISLGLAPNPSTVFATDPLPKAAPVLSQGPFDGTLSNNETTIEYHPTNPNIAVAGSNGTGGQRMSFSSDGGVTWGNSGAFAGTCCDPAIDFNSNGSIVYAATLPRSGTGGCGFGLCAGVYWSFNNGQNWTGPVNASTASSDKEWIHVDRSPTSPFRDRLYMTWHQGNVMQFARSTAAPVQGGAGLTFAPTISFAADERGIGSDITTDRMGRVYHVYPSVTGGSAEMYLLRSDDGGDSFVDLNGAAPGLAGLVFDLRGRFDFAIPAMESRRVFIYASVDTDQSGGPRDGRVYVAFTDETPESPGNGTGTAAQSHGWVRVMFSDDQGVTWSAPTSPHAITDTLTVDRFQPWIDVDNLGNVHIGWQDTRNSGAGLRDKADWYYAVSTDGGVTWIEETRVSDVVSQNITNGQEWGDYNGISVAADGNTIGMTWTDNRIVGAAPIQRSFAGRVQSLVNGPSYQAAGSNLSQQICAATPPVALQPINVSYSVLNGFANPVSVAFNPSLPAGLSGSLSASSVTPPGMVQASISAVAGVTPGVKDIMIRSTGTGPSGPIVRDVSAQVEVFTQTATAPALAMPADNAAAVITLPMLSWTAAPQTQDYLVEVATNPAFKPVLVTQIVTGTSFTLTAPLQTNTRYFWRVSARNICAAPRMVELFQDGFEDPVSGSSAVSAVRSFVTQAGPGDCPVGTTATTLFSEGMEAGAPGWTTSTAVGTTNWAISNAFPASGANAHRGIAPITAADFRLTTPPIAVPSGTNPRSLVFQNKPSLEVRTAGGCWDAGLLEVSTDNGATFTQVTAGISGRGYTGAIGDGNPAVGLQGWCGAATIPYALTAVDLAPFGGQTVQFRFRTTADTSVNEPNGWNIDDVRVLSCTPSP